ncbi:putative Type I restriction-modification system methylation subunit [Magnetospirillum sp. XM-1]|uniref:restriction endonuclease subunit S n=1 Tax=Magnetospirillum sp. XM-1 TaxID=1663591 RepID=UPI00073DC89B|nr:restriction endonuclease subunit S [Magnetospirillum sp. XM-1]CUW37515.1 putative Type I restriction-modification system methylation subunit [Magnetospirillum sp. XM-1]
MSQKVPEGWQTNTIGGLLSIDTPGFWGETPEGDEGNVNVLRSTNFVKSGLNYDTAASRLFPPRKIDQKRLVPGDILLERSGGSPTQPVGRVRKFDANGIYSASNFMQILRANDDVVCGDFLLLTLDFIYINGGTEALQKATTGIRNLDYAAYKQLQILLPPLREQRRIAEILSSVDEAIAATQAVIDQTRTVKQGVLKHLLTKGIGHSRFKHTEIGEIPDRWRVVSIGDLCSLTNGNGFRPPDWSDHGLPIIRIQNLNGSKNFNYFAGTPQNKWIIEPGDLLFSWAGVRGVSFGPCLWNGPRGVLNQHIFKVHPACNVEKEWLFLALKFVTSMIESKAHGFKDSLLHVHKSEITGQKIGLPDFVEQEKIASAFRSINEADNENLLHLNHLRNVKSALMFDLLTGHVRVAT